jgi:uroporphyrinogen-III synthase
VTAEPVTAELRPARARTGRRDNQGMADSPLAGMTVGVTAERRADDQVRLLAARGAEVLLGPAVRVFSLDDDQLVRSRTSELVDRPPDYLLASTGFGMRTWLAAAESWQLKDPLVASLSRARVANRGAKAASANIGVGLGEWFRAPTERFDELVDRVVAEPLAGRRVVIQVHGVTDPPALRRLQEAGAEVIEIDAYRLSMPADPGPARELVRAACAGRLAAVTFVVAPAVHNVFTLARELQLEADLRDAFNGGVVAACVGPVCAEGAIDEGVRAPLVPGRSRLVPLIQTLTERLAALRRA